jgi:shikimate kinase
MFSLLLALSVVFPRDGQVLPPVSRCYVIGSVEKGVPSVTVQGREVPVYHTGAWATTVDLVEGSNTVKVGDCDLKLFVRSAPKNKTAARAAAKKTYEKLEYAADTPKAHPAGRKPGEIIEQDGEAAFRKIESQILADLAKEYGQVIATGGGVVEREENMRALAHNGYFILLTKKLRRLATKGRPLSKDPAALAALYARRKPLYEKWADLTVDNDRYYKDTLAYILRMLEK